MIRLRDTFNNANARLSAVEVVDRMGILLYQPDKGKDERVTDGDVDKTVIIPEDVERAAKRVRHADIESSEIAEEILENTETE